MKLNRLLVFGYAVAIAIAGSSAPRMAKSGERLSGSFSTYAKAREEGSGGRSGGGSTAAAYRAPRNFGSAVDLWGPREVSYYLSSSTPSIAYASHGYGYRGYGSPFRYNYLYYRQRFYGYYGFYSPFSYYGGYGYPYSYGYAYRPSYGYLGYYPNYYRPYYARPWYGYGVYRPHYPYGGLFYW